MSEGFYHCAQVPVTGRMKKMQSDPFQRYPLNAQEGKGTNQTKKFHFCKNKPLFFCCFLCLFVWVWCAVVKVMKQWCGLP